MRRTAGLALILSLGVVAGCGGGDENAGGVTKEESRELNEAAEMLDVSPDSLAAPEDMPLGNGEAASNENASTGELPVKGDDTPTS